MELSCCWKPSGSRGGLVRGSQTSLKQCQLKEMIPNVLFVFLLIGQTLSGAKTASSRGMMADTCPEVVCSSDATGNHPAAAEDQSEAHKQL